jgi:hypothetical protein
MIFPLSLAQAFRIGTERPRFISPGTVHDNLTRDRSIGIGNHPAGLVIGAATDAAFACLEL